MKHLDSILNHADGAKRGRPLRLIAGFLLATGFAHAQSTSSADNQEAEVVELSPFQVSENQDSGYYASQTLSGGRLGQNLKDIGSSVQVINLEFMKDIAATDLEELLLYTTGTEAAGIRGNYTGFDGAGAVFTHTEEARREPDQTNRVRGLGSPTQTRNFFASQIPFDSYNTERLEINRGANSFLFGLGSPAGLINTQLAKARFTNSTEISTRIGSGGENLSMRGSIGLNRVLIEDKLAVRVNALVNRAEYRQRPTYKDDDRIYAAMTLRPFRSGNTTLRAHIEVGEQVGNAPDVALPVSNLNTFLDDPFTARASMDVYDNIIRFRHTEGPSAAQYAALTPAEQERYIIRDSGTWFTLNQAGWYPNAFGMVFDGTNGDQPSFAYTPSISFLTHLRGDPFFDPDNRGGLGNINEVYHGNTFSINGVGWINQGLTDLETFDWSKASLGWDSDFYSRDFSNYNVSLEQLFLDGKVGFEAAFDYQDIFKRSFTAFNDSSNRIFFDINETLLIPTDLDYRNSGVVAATPNPNYGRPFIYSAGQRQRNSDTQQESSRFTGFFKHDFANGDHANGLLRFLGSHTVSVLADRSVVDNRTFNYAANSFGDPDPALNLPTTAGAGSYYRNVPSYSYIGPQQLDAFTDPNFTIQDFELYPAKYQIKLPNGFSMPNVSWNLGPDSTHANRGLASRRNGNEGFVAGTLVSNVVPVLNNFVSKTTVTSLAANSQSFLLDDLLVVNLGYREDTVRTLVNNAPDLVGYDLVPDISPENFHAADGLNLNGTQSVFGYGGVLSWPRKLIKLPEGMDLRFHFNHSDNFDPGNLRVDIFNNPIDSPTGSNEEYGFSVSMLNNKAVARFNWYEGSLNNATSTAGGVYNSITHFLGLTHEGRLNTSILSVDEDKDGVIDQRIRDEVQVDPDTGLTSDGLTVDQQLAVDYPYLTEAHEALAFIKNFQTDELRRNFNYTQLANGGVSAIYPQNTTDTFDLVSKGFEFELTLNPTKNWRIAFNAAKQQTVRNNVSPRLTTLLDDFVFPYMDQWGQYDFSDPVRPVVGNTIFQQTNSRLLQYYNIKAQEGLPASEIRKWRANLITNYRFTEGRLKGFSVGGAIRWQDSYAIGYPLTEGDYPGLIVQDIANPYYSDDMASYDIHFGYHRKLFDKFNWSVQLNVRNLQNWNSDEVSAMRLQPDGSIARARFDPPREILLTNTIRF